jgi:hypothetical protein
MGQCCSTWTKPWHKASKVFATKFKKGFAKLVIPMSRLNLQMQLNCLSEGAMCNLVAQWVPSSWRKILGIWLQHMHDIITSGLEATNDLSNLQVSILPIWIESVIPTCFDSVMWWLFGSIRTLLLKKFVHVTLYQELFCIIGSCMFIKESLIVENVVAN